MMGGDEGRSVRGDARPKPGQLKCGTSAQTMSRELLFLFPLRDSRLVDSAFPSLEEVWLERHWFWFGR